MRCKHSKSPFIGEKFFPTHTRNYIWQISIKERVPSRWSHNMAGRMKDDLPPSYSNLGYDFESAAGPSAPPEYREEFGRDFRGSTSHPSAPPMESGSRPIAYNAPNLVFENIYEACVNYADERCCYGKRFLNQMKLLDVINKSVFYYKIESFGEKRESQTKSAPYKSGPIDASRHPPDPWDVTVLPPDLFKDCKTTVPIPHTDVVRSCSICSGNGNIRCDSCHGVGRKPCSNCSGRGTDLFYTRCDSCSGSGTRMCWYCFGAGTNTCSCCSGYGKIKFWKVLNVKWKNHVDEYFTDAGNIPIDLIRKAKGVQLVKKKDKALEPIRDAPDAAVNIASSRLLESHMNAFPDEMIIRQRHVLRAVPLTRVTYKWKEKDGEFYVYDSDRKVYFEDYPQSCCSCICS